MKLLVSLFVVGGSIFMLRMSHDKPCCDHQGNIYGNIKSMCSFWHINPETFNRRIKVYGMTVEEALTRPVKPNGGLQCTDHCGEKFFSITAMCEYWGIQRKVYTYRISHGWTQEDALTKPSRYKIIQKED